jgi:glycosyltransferase involved in cell wall biosynthesis
MGCHDRGAKNMKVILAAKSVYPFHPVGGVQKYVYNFGKALLKKGVDVEIVAPLDEKRTVRREEYEGLKYTFLRPAIYKYLEYPAGWIGVHLFSWNLAHYLKGRSFDLLHAFDMCAFRYLKLKERRPVVTHTFTDNFLTNPIRSKNIFSAKQTEDIKQKKVVISPFADAKTRRQYFIQYMLKTKPMHVCFKESEAVFYEAEEFVNEVNDIYRLDRKKSRVLPVGIDLDFVQKMSDKKRDINRESLGLNHDHIVLITVNRLAADKGVDKVILALEKLIVHHPQMRLIIIGQGYQEKELYKMIEEKKLKEYVLHFRNVPEEELYSYYKLSNIYICAFSYPGSSISTIEAMACGLPVITTAQPWLIKGNGITIEDNHPDKIEKAVEGMLENNLKAMGEKSEEIAKGYDWASIADQALSYYKDMVRK